MSGQRLPAWTGDELDVDLALFGSKTCSHCGRELPANTDYFTQDRSRIDGMTSWCRRCRADYSAAYHEANRERRNEANRARSRKIRAAATAAK